MFYFNFSESSALTLYRHFVYSSLVASTVEISRDENVNTFQSDFRSNKSGRHNKNIGIIMGTCKTRQFRLPAQGCTYPLMFV